MSLITKEQLKTSIKLFKKLLSFKADKSALNEKEDKLVGVSGQIVGFDENGKAIAQKIEDNLPAGTPWIEKEGNSKVIYHKLPKSLLPDGIGSSHFVKAKAKGAMRHVDSVSEDDSYTVGEYAFAEGYNTTASGNTSHAEGYNTIATGYQSHAEGDSTTASGGDSHAEGNNTTASGDWSHAEGNNTTASGNTSHAEGYNTTASGFYSHAEGWGTMASGDYSHAEGCNTKASGFYSHAEGCRTIAKGSYSHAEGVRTTANSQSQHVQGENNILDTENTAGRGTYAHIVGNGSYKNGTTTRSNAHTLDWSGNAWFAGDVYVGSTSGKNKDSGSKKLATEEYVSTQIATIPTPDVSGQISAATTALKNELLNGAGEAYDTLKELGDLIDNNTDALEALETIATNKSNATNLINGLASDGNAIRQIGATAEDNTYTLGKNASAFGENTKASGESSHAEGWDTTASGDFSHAEGQSAYAIGEGSHAEGVSTHAGAYASHAEGYYTEATGESSHAEGYGTTANSRSQHVQGEYNVLDKENAIARRTYAHIVGNGASESTRSNAHTLDWKGNAWFAGDVYVGSTSGKNKDDGSKKLVTVDEMNAAIAAAIEAALANINNAEEVSF